MPFDFDDMADRSAPARNIKPMRGDDLEAIVTLIQLADMYLTDDVGREYNFDQLFNKMAEIGGPEIELKEADVRIVLNQSRNLSARLRVR